MSARNPDFRTVAVCVLHDLTSIFKHFLALVLFEIFFFFMWERERDFLVFFFLVFSLMKMSQDETHLFRGCAAFFAFNNNNNDN